MHGSKTIELSVVKATFAELESMLSSMDMQK